MPSNGEIGFCKCNPCSENEGDCDSDDECQDGHICGYNNCPISLGFGTEVDCCVPSKFVLMYTSKINLDDMPVKIEFMYIAINQKTIFFQ